MLGGAGMRNLFSPKMLGEVDIKKVLQAHLTQYIKRGWHEKARFTENGRGGWYKKAPLTKYVRWGFLL